MYLVCVYTCVYTIILLTNLNVNKLKYVPVVIQIIWNRWINLNDNFLWKRIYLMPVQIVHWTRRALDSGFKDIDAKNAHLKN